jgi:hypothetical protein
MANPFDMAREIARLTDRSVGTQKLLSGETSRVLRELLRTFPGATGTEIDRAFDILLDRVEMALEEEKEYRDAIKAASSFIIGGAPPQAIGAMIQQLKVGRPKPFGPGTLFPKPDKTKS